MADLPKRQSLFRNRNYMTMFSGQMLSSIGSNVYSFALLWDMKVLTNNTFLMALVGIGWMVPQVAFGPFAGVLVDRFNKRWTMFWSDGIRLVITAIVTMLAFAHALNAVEIILSAFLLNMAATLFSPAAGALTPLMVDADQLAAANGMEQSSGPLANILGPAISAGLIAWQGVPMAFAINAGTFVISVLTLFAIRVGEPKRELRSLGVRSFFAELKDGFLAIRRLRLLMVIMPVAFFINFLFAPMDLYFVQFVTVALHRTQVTLGVLNSFFAVGMLAGALTAGIVSQRLRPGYLMAGGILISCLLIVCLATVSWLPLLLVILFFMGVAMGWVNVPIVTMIQQSVSHEYLGRVFGLLGTTFGAAAPLGMLVGGYVAHAYYIRDDMAVSGLIGTLLGLSMFLIPTVRQAGRKPLPTEPSSADAVTPA